MKNGKKKKSLWKMSAVFVCVALLLFSQFGIYLPTDIHEVPDSGNIPGDIPLIEQQNVLLVDVYVSQDIHDNTLYVEMGGDKLWQPLDVRRRFKIPFHRRATRNDVKVLWYSKENGTEMVDQPDTVNALSARVIISDGKKEIFNHFESFIEKKNTIEGWVIMHCDVFNACSKYIPGI
ncbi:hypothetical protein B9G54_03730 [Alloscardovia macacae]|uniref:Uncharacterized protein n=1 Tax=Alloscardovia macacae TaxID=1160091 RepID=A0A1Y2SUD5_9BIFI|nr:hypothetical protein [Alloscardovia macacae]OTA26697.1 hypothetical protein B9G54_03730 [Alloscardovia macacae]OTA29563.1 hypothetical protein B9T39_02880 [Alloscardovia macacae]